MTMDPTVGMELDYMHPIVLYILYTYIIFLSHLMMEGQMIVIDKYFCKKITQQLLTEGGPIQKLCILDLDYILEHF